MAQGESSQGNGQPQKGNKATRPAISRRELVGGVAGAGAAALASTATASTRTWMPSTAEGMRRLIGANDRLGVAQVGVGGQGNVHVDNILHNSKDWNVEYVAICDIYSAHRENTAKKIGLSDSQTFVHYADMLDSVKGIDVVWVTTPEHWHFGPAVAAMEAGKHVYVEKPMCKGVDEALKMHEVCKRTNAVLQVGSQGCTDPTYHRIGELVSSGKYGPVVWAQGSYCRNTPGGEWNYYGLDAGATPDNTHWTIFEQPCHHKHPFSKDRFFRWRKYWSYSAGIQGDLFPHVLHPFLIAIGKWEYPRRVVALGDLLVYKDREVPDTIQMVIEYPSQFTVVLSGSTVNDTGLTPTIRTNKATIEFAMFGGGQVHLMPQHDYADEFDEINEHVPGAGEDIPPHELNFLECVRDRSKTPNCPIDLATPVQIAISMGEMAYRQQREVRFDVENKRLI